MEGTIIIMASSYWAQAISHNPTQPILKSSKPRLESCSNFPDIAQSARDKVRILIQVYTNPQPRSLLCQHLAKLESSILPSTKSVHKHSANHYLYIFFPVSPATNCKKKKKCSCPQSPSPCSNVHIIMPPPHFLIEKLSL